MRNAKITELDRVAREASDLLGAMANEKRLMILCHLIDGETTVYSLALQEHWKSRAKLAALTKAMTRTVELAGRAGVARIGVPRIGTGLGGLDWPRVKSVLTKIGDETPVEIVVFEKFVRARPE